MTVFDSPDEAAVAASRLVEEIQQIQEALGAAAKAIRRGDRVADDRYKRGRAKLMADLREKHELLDRAKAVLKRSRAGSGLALSAVKELLASESAEWLLASVLEIICRRLSLDEKTRLRSDLSDQRVIDAAHQHVRRVAAEVDELARATASDR